MTTKTVYLFDRPSMLYNGTYEAQESPEEPGEFITPDDSTEMPAPEFDPSHKTCKYQEPLDDWLVEPIAVQASIQEPETVLTLDVAKTAQLDKLAITVQARIFNGFASSALGTQHTYPAKERDQQNLTAIVSESLLPLVDEDWKALFWCADGAGEWALVEHTASQIQQVQMDANASRKAAVTLSQMLTAQINAIEINSTTTEAEAIAAVQSTTWT
jgi:hypothetical protein